MKGREVGGDLKQKQKLDLNGKSDIEASDFGLVWFDLVWPPNTALYEIFPH